MLPARGLVPRCEVTMILDLLPTNILGLDLLKGQAWLDSKGRELKFTSPVASIRLLQSAPTLPPSKIVNVKPYALLLAAREGITPVITELWEQGTVIPMCSPSMASLQTEWKVVIDYSLSVPECQYWPINSRGPKYSRINCNHTRTRPPDFSNYWCERHVLYGSLARSR